MAIETRPLGESSSVAELEAKLADLQKQRAVAQTRVNELTEQRAALVVPALAESDTAAAARLDEIDPELTTETRRLRDLDLVVGHIESLLVPARLREDEQVRAERIAALETKISQATAATERAKAEIARISAGELRHAVKAFESRRHKLYELIDELHGLGGETEFPDIAMGTEPGRVLVLVATESGLPEPVPFSRLRAEREEAEADAAQAFHAGRAAGRREIETGGPPTPYQRRT